MKILRKGRKPHKLYRGKCRECGCEIECEEHEAKWNPPTDVTSLGDGPTPRELPGFYSFQCPNCTVGISLKEAKKDA